MDTEQAIKMVLGYMRDTMSQCTGPERAVLQRFSEEIGAEVEGWDMRLKELENVPEERK